MKTKILLLIIFISFAGIHAQQKAKLQKADESGFIEVDKMPELISQLNPEYPKLAKLAGIHGTVYLKLLIDEKGNVAKAKIEQGAQELLDNSVIQAANKAKFSPAMLNNKPVKVWVILPVAFKLGVDKQDTRLNVSGEDPDPNAMVPYEKGQEMIEAAKPNYPEIAKSAGITGKVFIKVLVDKEGMPKKAMVIKSENEIFNQSAIDAAMKSKFSPAIQEGKPVAVWIVLPYKFALDGEKKDDPKKGEVKQFDTAELAKDDYNANIYMYENKENREGIGAPKGMTFEKMDSQISFGDESALYKMSSEKKSSYIFIARKKASVYKFTAPTIEKIQRYVDDLELIEKVKKYENEIKRKDQ